MSYPWISPPTLTRLLDRHARWAPCPLVPSYCTWTVDDELPLWQALEAELGRSLDAPFFAVSWPGSQALVLAMTRGLIDVRDATVLEIGCGNGLAALCAARNGARVVATDPDPLACSATRALAQRWGVPLSVVAIDALANAQLGCRFDMIFAGDVVYSRAIAALLARAIPEWDAAPTQIWLADSGRPFFCAHGLPPVLRCRVEVPVGVEGKAHRDVTVYGPRILPTSR